MVEELVYWLALARLPWMGIKRLEKLQKNLPDWRKLFTLSTVDLLQLGLNESQCEVIRETDLDALHLEIGALKARDIALVCYEDNAYPALLKQIASPPPILYAEGDVSLLARSQIAVVGARSPSLHGRETSYHFGYRLAEMGIVVTSGMALGIDGEAHRGALDAGGHTIAVLGSGLDNCYPPQHKLLKASIVQKGVVISEYSPSTPPRAHHFPRRNRMISGLSLGVLVVEAALKSGSLLTAKLALEQNREIFAVPGSIHNPRAKGCHYLLRQGAKLVESVEDILEELPHLPYKANKMSTMEKSGSHLEQIERSCVDVYQCVEDVTVSLDALVALTGYPIEQVTTQVMMLELQGVIISVPGGYVRAKGTHYERTRA